MDLNGVFLKQQEELEKKQLGLYDQAQAIYEDDGKAEINGREYSIRKCTHKDRLQFLQYYNDIASKSAAFKYETIERMLSKIVMFDGKLLQTMNTHWDEYPEDYEAYINIMPLSIQYPLLVEKHTNLKSQFLK